MKSAELKLERVALADLKPHPKNPRRLPEPGSAEWEALRKSLAQDYFDPIMVNSGATHRKLKNVLASGHLRVKVLIADGYTHADAVIKDYDEARHVQVMLRANNQSGEWDESALAELLKDIPDGSIDLMGFTAGEIERILAAATIPGGNKPIDEGALGLTKCECPSCGFKW